MTDTSVGGTADRGRRRMLVRLLAVIAVVALVAVAARSADRATVDDVLSIPQYGTVRADRLGNGTPVFVVAQPPEAPGGSPQIDVMQAFTTELDHPVTGLVGWCADAGQFVDAHHGPLYDVRGRRLPSSIVGRELPARLYGQHTALDDLIHRVVTTIEDRVDAEDPLVVSGVQGLQAWQVADRPALDPDVPPEQCRLADDPLVQDASALFRRVIDHSFYAGPIDPEASGWQITDGWMLLRPDGNSEWCDEEPVGDAPTCPAQRDDVTVALGLSAAEVGPVPVVLGGPLAVRLRGGAVVRAAVMADSTWRGSSLRGTWSHTATLVGAPTTADPSVALRDVVVGPDQLPSSRPAGDATDGAGADGFPPGTPDRCPGTWTDRSLPSGPAVAVPVDAATRVDVSTARNVFGIDQLEDLEGGVPVVIVVDAITCAALSITGAP